MSGHIGTALTKNEILHFYKGDPMTIYISKDGIDFTSVTLGENNNFHLVQLRPITGLQCSPNGDYSLIGCTVAPGFDYADFELAAKDWKPINFSI